MPSTWIAAASLGLAGVDGHRVGDDGELVRLPLPVVLEREAPVVHVSVDDRALGRERWAPDLRPGERHGAEPEHRVPPDGGPPRRDQPRAVELVAEDARWALPEGGLRQPGRRQAEDNRARQEEQGRLNDAGNAPRHDDLNTVWPWTSV